MDRQKVFKTDAGFGGRKKKRKPFFLNKNLLT